MSEATGKTRLTVLRSTPRLVVGLSMDGTKQFRVREVMVLSEVDATRFRQGLHKCPPESTEARADNYSLCVLGVRCDPQWLCLIIQANMVVAYGHFQRKLIPSVPALASHVEGLLTKHAEPSRLLYRSHAAMHS